MTSGIPRATNYQSHEIRQAPALQVPCVRQNIQGLLLAGRRTRVPEVRSEEKVTKIVPITNIVIGTKIIPRSCEKMVLLCN